jgi:hypothetical protein
MAPPTNLGYRKLMRGPLGFYLDWIDDQALANADGTIGAYSGPFMPLVVPAAIGGLAIYVLRSADPSLVFGLIIVTAIVSLASWSGFMIYFRAVERHRKELGLPGWRERMRGALGDDQA